MELFKSQALLEVFHLRHTLSSRVIGAGSQGGEICKLHILHFFAYLAVGKICIFLHFFAFFMQLGNFWGCDPMKLPFPGQVRGWKMEGKRGIFLSFRKIVWIFMRKYVKLHWKYLSQGWPMAPKARKFLEILWKCPEMDQNCIFVPIFGKLVYIWVISCRNLGL